jgi:uncharacterized protein (TIGR02265 family)
MADAHISPGAPRAAPSESRTRLVYATGVEGLFLRALKDRLTPELKAKIRAEGVDLEKKLALGYPLDVWIRCVDAAAQVLYPTLTLEEAHWTLGADFIRGYAETMIGRAMFGVLRLLGPMKAIAQLERSFRTGNNYVRTSFIELSPTSAEVWIAGVEGQPWFNAGIMLEGGRRIGAKNLRVEILHCAGDEATYRVSWDA